MSDVVSEAAAGAAAPLSTTYGARVSRLVTRLPRMLTESDDYSWVPMGDVLVALMDIDSSEEAWPEGEPAPKMTALLELSRLRRIEAAARGAQDSLARFLWDGDTNDGGDDDLVVDAHAALRAALSSSQPTPAEPEKEKE